MNIINKWPEKWVMEGICTENDNQVRKRRCFTNCKEWKNYLVHAALETSRVCGFTQTGFG